MDGKDIYEILFDGEALIFIGEVHILQEQSYLVKIYKKIKEVTLKNRLLEDTTNTTSEEEVVRTNTTTIVNGT